VQRMARKPISRVNRGRTLGMGRSLNISEMQARSKRALDAMVVYGQTRQACQVNNYNLYSTLHHFTPFDSI
jgi:hypothetical protein